MHDAHFHYTKALHDKVVENPIKGICNTSNEIEYKLVKDLFYLVSAGIHPWYVDQVNWDSFFPCLEEAKIIGEIGLDNTWCSTDKTLQKEVFEKQLEYASLHKKPVILHLKGMEKEAYSFVSKYPNTYIVHWHSTKEMIQEYVDLGCFFTIGPSIGIDEAVDEVCRCCPIDKLLIETDGIEAIAWAYKCDEKDVDYFMALKRSIEKIAEIKNVSVSQMEIQLDKNFNTLETKIGMN